MLESIAIIILFGLLFGKIFEMIKLPGIVGMIVAGIFLSPSMFNLLDPKILNISSEIREIALVVILTRAGLSLDIYDLLKVGRPVLLLSMLPAIFEIIGMVILGPALLGLSVLDSAIIGCVLAAVSPAVVVPRMLNLINKFYGSRHKVPQILISGSSIDDIFVIILFTSLLGLTQNEAINALTFLKIPVSIVMGVVLGIVMAFGLMFLFKKIVIRDTIKVLILIGASLFALQIEESLKEIVPISGFLAMMSIGVVFKNYDKKNAIKLSMKYNEMWSIAEIFLFVLVGVTIDVNHIFDSGLMVVLIILIALIFRSLGVYASLIKTRLTFKERTFCAIAYMPKATVQAVIGGVPLAMGLYIGDITLTFAVLSILITAPLGAFLIDLTYSKLLKKDDVWSIIFHTEEQNEKIDSVE